MQQFSDDYTRALADYVTAQGGKVPCRAVQLGQQASAEGLSASTILNVHYEAVRRMRAQARQSRSSNPLRSPVRYIASVSTFFRESLAAYEAANAQLTRENGTLLQMNEALEMQANRIAHALHDDAGQLLTVAHLKLAKAQQKASPECAAYLVEIRALFDDIEQQLRRFSHELHPIALQDFGLIGALEFLIQGVEERAGLHIRVNKTPNLTVPKPLETILYRFVQEALTNVVRHAHATTVTIEFRQTNDTLTCVVVDDGVGFDADKFRPGMGLSGMRQRVQAASGKLSLKSSPGLGSELIAEIPLTVAEMSLRNTG